MIPHKLLIKNLHYTYFPTYAHFGSWKKTRYAKNRVSGTVGMFQLTWNSPTSTYIS